MADEPASIAHLHHADDAGRNSPTLEALRREVLRLAIPAVGEQMVLLMAGIVETVLIGHLGAAPLVALGLSNQLAMLSTVLFTLLAVGGGVLVAQATGAGQVERVHRVFGQSLWLSLLTGVGLMLTGLLVATPALRLMGAEAEAVRLGTPFLRLLAASMPFQGFVFVASACLRGAGDTRTPMLVVAATTIVQVLSSAALVYGVGGFAEMGTPGAAVGALAGRAAGAGLLLVWLWHGRLPLRLREVNWRIDRPAVEEMVRLGSPSGGEQLALRLGQIANVRIVAGLGTVGYAAYLVAFNSVVLAFLIGIGFTAAATTVVGQRVGAGDEIGARSGARQAWGLAAGTMGLMGIAFAFAARPLLGFFTSDLQVVALGVVPLQLVSLALPAEATNQVLSGALRGAGDTRWPMVVTATGNWLIRLPLTLILAGPFGLIGVWWAVIADMVLRALVNIWRFRGTAWLPAIRPRAVVEQSGLWRSGENS